MQNSIHVIVMTALVFGLAQTAGARDTTTSGGAPVKDLDDLRGKWELLQVILNGKTIEKIDDEQVTIEITDGQMILYHKGIRTDPMDLRIDASRTPKEIYLGPGKSASKGIYKVEGDTLTICVGLPRGHRPRGFVSHPEDSTAVLVFKRLAR